MYSAHRTASAPMVEVGFTAPPVVSELPATMNRFGTSQVWFHLFVTEAWGLLPGAAGLTPGARPWRREPQARKGGAQLATHPGCHFAIRR
ncbi:MAG: hypothetical protein WAK82_14170 [Streptosporangiaceae bacterium]